MPPCRPAHARARHSASDSRQGYVLCAGDTAEDAVAKAEAARDLVRIDSVPLAEGPGAARRP
ncbi:hypothetical protein [Streptomyces sp. R44]|uniref:L-amino acid ligase C-terminal domain-containing protein n=1 Tax=Streptomyces sp. R44 TaxID=3238633 RepID=A0AB39TE35_9ACTN